jgi:DNA-binding IclR family transcriptional regulator
VNKRPESVVRSEPPNDRIGSVDRALRLLLLLTRESEIRIADASRELQVGRSTAHRLMQMLVYYGFAEQNPGTRAYQPGPMLRNAGITLVGNVDVREAARPHLEALAGHIQETVHLQALRRDGHVVCVDSVESSQPLRVGSRTGEVFPPHATAGGKALLSTLSDEAIAKLFPDEALEIFTPTTVPTRSALLAELAEIRKRGYAISHAGQRSDISGVAVPVPDPSGASRLAIAVAVPTVRFGDEQVPNIASAAIETARRVAATLGG